MTTDVASSLEDVQWALAVDKSFLDSEYKIVVFISREWVFGISQAGMNELTPRVYEQWVRGEKFHSWQILGLQGFEKVFLSP